MSCAKLYGNAGWFIKTPFFYRIFSPNKKTRKQKRGAKCGADSALNGGQYSACRSGSLWITLKQRKNISILPVTLATFCVLRPLFEKNREFFSTTPCVVY